MDNEQISMMDILIETHAGLKRQGPGSGLDTTGHNIAIMPEIKW